ncbi:MAG TPA: GldG family protein [Clostridia bacterium]|nr:GldG family protein [Clostridia bacterium]
MKKLNKISMKNSFKDKKFKYGGYATLMTAVVLAIVVVINLVVGQIPFKLDLTENRMFSLSEQTDQILENLDQDVQIIGLSKTGAEDKMLDEILQRYRRGSKHVSITYIDPVKNPTFSSKYTKDGTNLREGSYIVESGSKFKVIDYYDLFNISQPDQYGNTRAESLAVEQRVTGAIHYVTAEDLPTVYTLEGHMEQPIPVELRKQMELENYIMENLSLLTEDNVPDDATILMVIAPQQDITPQEEAKIREFLDNKGRAVFLMDVIENDLPNFDALLKSYGIGLNRALTVEGDKNHYFQSPAWILPNMESHDIINPLRNSKRQVLAIGAQGIEELDIKKRSTDIEPLLVTSNNAWGRTDLASTTSEREEGDLEGPFNIAVAITDKEWDDKEGRYDETKLVVVGDAEFLNPQFASIGNADFMLNSLNWLQDEQENISIRPKSILTQFLTINPFQQLVFAGISVILIPLIILGVGLVMWLRRRHL